MLTLRITQKIARKLGVPLPAVVPVAGHPAADWCCQPFQVGRQRFVLGAMDDTNLPKASDFTEGNEGNEARPNPFRFRIFVSFVSFCEKSGSFGRLV